jgi:hypothetical protein
MKLNLCLKVIHWIPSIFTQFVSHFVSPFADLIIYWLSSSFIHSLDPSPSLISPITQSPAHWHILLIRLSPSSIILFPSHSLTRLVIYILTILTLFFIRSLVRLFIYLFAPITHSLFAQLQTPSLTHSHILPRPPKQSLSRLLITHPCHHAFSLTRSIIHILSHKAGYLSAELRTR